MTNLEEGDRMVPEDLKGLAEFHGHLCPGVVLMGRMAQAAMRHLGARRHDRNLQAVVESARCHVAAVEWFTGCTGRRRLIVKDWGLAAATVLDRKSGRAVRVHLKPDFPPAGAMDGFSNEEKFHFLVKTAPEEYVRLDEVEITEALPSTESPTRVGYCDGCGERMIDHICREVDGRQLCMACAEPYFRKLRTAPFPRP